jgi:hypothetical protein
MRPVSAVAAHTFTVTEPGLDEPGPLPYVESVRRIPVLLLALAAAGCGAGTSQTTAPPTSASPQQLIAGAADATAKAGSARMTMDMTMTLGTEGTMDMHGDGRFDMRAKRGTMDLVVHELGKRIEMREIVDGTIVYVKIPAPLSGGKHWMKVDTNARNAAGMNLGALSQANQGDPTQALSYLRGASSSIVRVGAEAVRGTPTTHYHAVIDLGRIAANAPADVREEVRHSIDQMSALTGITSLPVEVWIDGQGRVRREVMDMRFENTAMAGVTMHMSMDLFDFGTPVDVTVPPEGDTFVPPTSTMTVN